MKIEVSEVGLPSQTSHSQSLSGREDCGGWDLSISGVGLNKTEKKRKDVTEISECQSKAFELKSWSLIALNILHVFVHFLQISLRYRQWFKLFKVMNCSCPCGKLVSRLSLILFVHTLKFQWSKMCNWSQSPPFQLHMHIPCVQFNFNTLNILKLNVICICQSDGSSKVKSTKHKSFPKIQSVLLHWTVHTIYWIKSTLSLECNAM